MSALGNVNQQMTRYRWVICAMLFFATTVNYLDRQVLSLLQPMLEEEFHWTDNDYGTITAIFSLFYAISMLFAGRFIDWMGTRKGYAWSIAVWSAGAALHALCGVLTEKWVGLPDADALRAVAAGTDLAATISMVSVTFFIIARCVLALGEAGNFPAAIKATAEYFPKKDRAFATGIFNSGANVGAIVAPLTVPLMAELWGWEMAFIIVGLIGFIWMGIWLFIYKPIAENPKVNDAERAYIQQDDAELTLDEIEPENESKLSFIECLGFKQTWAFAFGKFMTDGVWWFFLFWTPAYLKIQYNMEGTQIAWPIAILYSITVIGSVFGGKFPTYFINRGMNPYAGRMRAMLIIAFFPLVVLFAQPLGYISYWVPILLISVGASAHQAWSANIFSTVGDMFPKSAIATITGIGGMAGGIGSFFIQKGAGMLFTYSGDTNMQFMGFEGKPAGYAIVFIFCAVAYLIGWIVMKMLVPKYKVITLN
ncbi:MFS transporter [Parabacteroides sp. BX2]|jgi:MFS transporter, ACS family, hexuronate transporter|uniref:MFS transporter n=1 Tax=Parabacteroides segnis TaxID=2763058 RepID=A0ABR7E935_9BACT|nr:MULTISPECIES: MFS transporter [Parabacteroides]MBC5645658.1 MFS transporter [Parabacteroides segnis]MCM0711315.1 MFS transporter [Parabacteroides sp. TA-V-105]